MSGSGAQALPEGRRGQILAVALVVIAAAFVWIAIVAPLAQWYAARAERLAESRAMAAHMAALASELPRLRNILAEAAPMTAGPAPTTLLSGDSDAIAAASLQGVVQDMAAGAGATLTSIEVLPAAQKGAFRCIGLRLTLNSDWAVLTAMLKAIETNDLKLFVDDLQLHAVADTTVGGLPADGDVPIDASFVVLAFRSGIGGDQAATARDSSAL